MEKYLKHGIFLPDINNEHEDKKLQYKQNLAGLHKLVLYRFADDETGENMHTGPVLLAAKLCPNLSLPS